MQLRYRYRHGLYPMEERSRVPQWIKTLLSLALALLIVYWVGGRILRLFGVGNPLMRASAVLTTEERGIVSVSLQGEQEQTAENGMTLFDGDSLSTGANAHASLRFFDGTAVRLDAQSAITLETSARGKKTSYIDLILTKGALWITTPSAQTFSGSIVRTIAGSPLSVELPSGTEAMLTSTMLAVYSSDGEGVRVSVNDDSSFIVGEGQQWQLPEGGTVGSDPYAHRSAIDLASIPQLVTESRTKIRVVTGGGTGGTGTPSASAEPLTVTEPSPDLLLKEATLTVRGSVGAAVASVEVNGHVAVLNAAKRTFSLEVSPPEGAAQFEVKVDAYDSERHLIDSVTRQVRREVVAASAFESPTIETPAKSGSTYRTQKEELVVRGTAPVGAVAMYVNDYKLQLFAPEKGTWSYLASTRLNNMKPGTNTYDVVAEDASGNKSAPVRLTILWEEGTEGVVSTGDAAGSASSSAALDPATLPTNTPLKPGSLTVTAPTAGTSHTETGTGFLIEGNTDATTASVWVNDYRLQLYQPGKTFWNYIASEALGNLKPGANVFVITARDDKNQIIDRLEYSVTKE